MKIVFLGTSKLGVNCLESLLKSEHEVVCVVTMPDKKAGRHLALKISPIKESALKRNIKVYQPEDINSFESVKFLKDLNADIFVVIAFGKILKKEVLDLSVLEAINVHFSLLPKYRGAAPINWAIANGETKTGVTIIKMNEFMDKGDIILQKEAEIAASDDAISLGDKLAQLAPQILVESLALLKTKRAKLIIQNESFASFAPSLKKSFGLINWNRDAAQIHNQVRAFVPWPGTFTYFKSMLLKIWKTEISEAKVSSPAGQVVEINQYGIVVATQKNLLLIKELQPEAKKIMTAQEFVNGHKLQVGDILGQNTEKPLA